MLQPVSAATLSHYAALMSKSIQGRLLPATFIACKESSNLNSTLIFLKPGAICSCACLPPPEEVSDLVSSTNCLLYQEIFEVTPTPGWGPE